MKNKIVSGFLVLLCGFSLGVVSFYVYEQKYRPEGTGVTGVPSPQKGVADTAGSFTVIARSISPSVVNIAATKTLTGEGDDRAGEGVPEFLNPFRDYGMPRKWKEQSLGSGVVVSGDGFVMTNYHVVEQAEEIRVTLSDQSSFPASVIGADAKTDVAIVKIDAENLQAIQWGNSEDLEVGEFVLAVGNPYGLSHTVTMGIISAVGRANVGIADYEDFIQTDAAINPGNSGGPLVNIHGALVGINTAIFSRSGGYQGIGFAVPSNMARAVMEQLLRDGRVRRGWLGVTAQEITPALAEKFGMQSAGGALVGDVEKDSPADQAGVVPGDIIVEFNGKKIQNAGNLRTMVARSAVGSVVSLSVLREGKERSLQVAVNELPTELSDIKPPPRPDQLPLGELIGLKVYGLSQGIARQLGLQKGETGVVVASVKTGGAADEAGIRKGDIIQEIERNRIASVSEFNRAISELRTGNSALIHLNRSGNKFFTVMTVH